MKNIQNKIGIKRTSDFSNPLWWLTVIFVLPMLIAIHFASAESANSGTVNFDHIKTGFILGGAHIQAPCTSCHIQGVFKGTPRDCASCHMAGNRMGATAKPNTHIMTNAQCDTCHKTSVWTPTTFTHVGLAQGSCLTCHNGTTATGKPSGHFPTTASCDACHKTLGWTQVVFTHTGVISGCANCHNGTTAKGTPPNHYSTPETINFDCSFCHTSMVTFKTASGTPLPANHLPTTQQCGLCHNMAGFYPGVMKHTGIVSSCATCHNGQSFLGVTPMSKLNAPTTHMTTALDCSSCHTSTSTFSVANLTTPPAGHLPTTQVCSLCHSSFGPGSGVMSHTGILSGCASCHNGQNFTGVTPVSKPSGVPPHLPTSLPCETCHSASSTNAGGFAGAQMNHAGIVNSCATCHSDGMSFAGVTPKRKQDAPTTHQVTSADCSTCHTSTVSFALASGATLPANHIPLTTQACTLCHAAGYSSSLTKMSHTGISSGCATCHDTGKSFYGITPVTKPSNHVPTTAVSNGANCETCHSPTKFTTFSGTAMKHTGIVSGCANCHNGQAFAGTTPVFKPVNHLPTSATCETCHSPSKFTSFSGTQMNHAGIVNNCTQCHNHQVFAGVTPLSKPNDHPATTADCSTSGCHTTLTFSK